MAIDLQKNPHSWRKSWAIGLLLLPLSAAFAEEASPQPNYRAQPRTASTPTSAEIALFANPDNPASEGMNSDLLTAFNDNPSPLKQNNKPQTMRDKAFEQLINRAMPMTPEQIIEYRKALYQSEQAINTPPVTPPRPVSSTITVDLSPGVPPPVIRLAPGFVTSMVFLDATGQPWPIADYSIGNSKQFNVQWDSKKNTLFIQSTSHFTSSNLALRLAELDTPIVISLVSGQKEVDYRTDIQVNGRGPNALAPVLDQNLPRLASAHLLNVLDGIPPTGSKALSLQRQFGQAWLSGHRLLFRTKLTVLSPAWFSTVSSPDGTRVYELPQTPLILATQDGKTIHIELGGF